MSLSTKQKGNILEKRFIEIVSLGTDGRVACFTPDSDDDGIDIIVNVKTKFQPIFIQVKSRFNLNGKGMYVQDVGMNTFKKNEKFYICFFLYDQSKFNIKQIWLVPSIDFDAEATEQNPVKSVKYKSKKRFAANPNDSSEDKWSQYKVDQKDLGNRVLSIIEEIYNDSHS